MIKEYSLLGQKLKTQIMFDSFCSTQAGHPPLRIERVCLVILEIVKWMVSIAITLEFLNILNVVELLESRGGTLCHHHADRCFSDSGVPWSVCARCTGMYLGWLLPVTLDRPLESWVCSPRVLFVATGLFVMAVACALLERFGVFSTSNELRACFGVPLGMFPAILVIFAIKHLKKSICTSCHQ